MILMGWDWFPSAGQAVGVVGDFMQNVLLGVALGSVF